MKDSDEDDDPPSGKLSALRFTAGGEPVPLARVADIFHEMAQEYGKPVPAAAMVRVGAKSGTHLLKLISPRADGEQAVLRLPRRLTNTLPELLPSVNAADIPFAKIAFRPIEILGYPARSVAEHMRAADGISEDVLAAFAAVFGHDVAEALRRSLLADLPPITHLPAAEFPIIFLPTPAGGDIQATPASPAGAYNLMKRLRESSFARRDGATPRPPRGCWSRQFVSAKQQNISGAIDKRRCRFLARFPGTLRRAEAELRRFVNGGGFPTMPGVEIVEAALAYADLLERSETYTNSDIRDGLDRRADSLIREAAEFIADIREEAQPLAPEGKTPNFPGPEMVILRRKWPGQTRDRVRQALASPHFRFRLAQAQDAP